jgi:hypothetical protein
MPSEAMVRKGNRVDKDIMSEASLARGDSAAPPKERARGRGPQKEDWIASQLKRVYDDALNEPIPQDMLDLLNALDEGAKSGSDGGEQA